MTLEELFEQHPKDSARGRRFVQMARDRQGPGPIAGHVRHAALLMKKADMGKIELPDAMIAWADEQEK